ncbi:hypothetical protein [Thiofilum flexile]|uniref:hypothetical protein n=1 Tax=Thiofilum flexile TaxID=125627 RepID=UPI00039F8CFD|nr:hypothetical protein [Thiofilum flexile]
MNGSKVTYHDDTIAINGYRMDWCLQWGKYCGQNAADVWCQRVNKTKSSVRATNFKRANDIGLTYVLQTRMVCNAPTCDGFEYITCELTGD